MGTEKRDRPRTTVILAAGFGQRMGSQDHGVPKPLMEVARRPLIEYALAQAAAAGCEEAVIVTGSGGDLVEEHLRRVECPLRITRVDNPEYHLPNGVSLLAAEPRVDGPFYLQMADHVFGEPVLARLLKGRDAGGGITPGLLVDRRPVYCDPDDATKVRLGGGAVTAIGKELTRWDAVDTGCFLLDGRVFDALRAAGAPEERSVTAGMRGLIAAGLLAAVELEEVAWVDVDTPIDRGEAERLFGERGPFHLGDLKG